MTQTARTWTLIAAGLATALLAVAHPILGEIYNTAGLLLFGFGVILAIYSHGQRRAFWLGFVILFGIYSSQTNWSLLQFAGLRNSSITLITTRLLSLAYEGLHPNFAMSTQGQWSGGQLPGSMIVGYIGFLTMGQTLIAAGLGVIGGRVAQRLASQSLPTAQRSLEQIMRDMDIQ